jgi:peptidyl-prolyl cis-trans isomerase C
MPLPLRPARLASAALALLVAAVLVAGCGQDSNADAGDDAQDDPIPYTLGEPITDSTAAVIVVSSYGTDTLAARDYTGRVQQMAQRIPPQQADSLLPQLHRDLVEGFVAQHVVIGEAAATGITADTAQVSQRIQALIQQRFDGNRAQFMQALEQAGLTLDSLRAMTAEQIRARTLQQQFAEEAEEPTAEEVEAFREEQRQEEVRAQHILFRLGQDAPEAKVDSVREVAAVILDSAKTGSADFEALARRHSEGPSASKGGDLGFNARGRMVPAFDEAMFAIEEEGAIAPELVRTRFGFHIIRLAERRMSPAMDSTRAVSQLMQERQGEAVEAAMDALMRDATVRINPAIVQADLIDPKE